jgi:hypothetical protein
LGRALVRPGDPLEIAIKIRRDDGPVRTEQFSLPIPRNWAGQEVDLIACGGELAQQVAEAVAGDPRPRDLRDVGRWLNARRLDGHLYLMAVRNGAGMRSEVETHAFLPPSVVAILSGDPTKQPRDRGLAWEERRAQPGELVGGVKSSIKVMPY